MKCNREKCNGNLLFHDFASMGGSHSNYYKCTKCGNIYEIYDRDEDNPSEYILCKGSLDET
jgi:uncharacterized protein YbcV (DUF1398 family)